MPEVMSVEDVHNKLVKDLRSARIGMAIWTAVAVLSVTFLFAKSPSGITDNSVINIVGAVVVMLIGCANIAFFANSVARYAEALSKLNVHRMKYLKY